MMTRRRSMVLPVLAMALMMMPSSMPAQEEMVTPDVQEVSEFRAPGVVQVVHPVLAERLAFLEANSPTFKAALDEVRATPGAYLALNVNKVPDPLQIAKTLGLEGGILIYVDLAKAELTQDELDTVILHEVYGHAIPVLLEGRTCDDPAAGAAWSTSCVAEREATILAELGRPTRATYAIGKITQR